MKKTGQLSQKEIINLLDVLQFRFENNQHRHKDANIKWVNIAQKLRSLPERCWSLQQMELTGGEPDILQYDKKADIYYFYDCCIESPKQRRSLCYDDKALADRKANKPKGSALSMAQTIGVQLMDEQQYRYLQSLEPVDQKTSSWLTTPTSIRKLGGAIFGDRRYDEVFVYHNGADSYYAARGFRGVLAI